MAFTGSSVAGKEKPTVFMEIAIIMLEGRVDRSVDIFPTQPVVSLLFLHWGEAYKSYRGKGACWSFVCTPLLPPPPQVGGAPVCYLVLRPISLSWPLRTFAFIVHFLTKPEVIWQKMWLSWIRGDNTDILFCSHSLSCHTQNWKNLLVLTRLQLTSKSAEN